MFTMAINRSQAKYVIAVTVLAITGTLLLTAAWIVSLPVNITIQGGALSITDVKFEKDSLNITVENVCTQAKVIDEVTVSYQGSVTENQSAMRRTIPLYEPISVGEQISIRVSFKWTSGHRLRNKVGDCRYHRLEPCGRVHYTSFIDRSARNLSPRGALWKTRPLMPSLN